MAENRGKAFEAQIKKAFETVPNTAVMRLIDPQNGFAGVHNICDFICYHYPTIYFVECKSCYGKSFPFTNITDGQWTGLLEMSQYKGVCAGYYIWFIDEDRTVFISAKAMDYLRKNSGRKSVNVYDFMGDLPAEYHFEWDWIVGKKKRVMFDYDLSTFIEERTNYDRSPL